MSLQEEELVSSHAGQPEQASSLLDQIMAQTRIQPGSEGYDVARQGVTALYCQHPAIHCICRTGQ